MHGEKSGNSNARAKPWFHNVHLPNGIQTAPNHPLGDFPSNKWLQIAPHIPTDLSGCNVLDIGCNAGFYSIELARRGARVTAVDVDEHYLDQARWAAKQWDLDNRITFIRMQVYELARKSERYDLVWFMGVFYHLRFPFLALNIVRRVVTRLMVFQTLTMPGKNRDHAEAEPDLENRDLLLERDWPKMAFIEGSFAHDPTNWWVPNHSCVEAMLRSSGFQVVNRPGDEIFLCEPRDIEPAYMSQFAEEELNAAVGSIMTPDQEAAAVQDGFRKHSDD